MWWEPLSLVSSFAVRRRPLVCSKSHSLPVGAYAGRLKRSSGCSPGGQFIWLYSCSSSAGKCQMFLWQSKSERKPALQETELQSITLVQECSEAASRAWLKTWADCYYRLFRKYEARFALQTVSVVSIMMDSFVTGQYHKIVGEIIGNHATWGWGWPAFNGAMMRW